MMKSRKQRKSAFTLVELLIVIMIIAILAGMMMLATGSATDSANATKIINDMRATKSAALMIYMDEGQSWKWLDGQTGAAEASLDQHMDRPLFTVGIGYSLLIKRGVLPITSSAQGGAQGQSQPRDLMGFQMAHLQEGVMKKLAQNAEKSGLYNADGTLYDGSTNELYMILH